MQTDYDTGQDVRAKTEETVSTLVDQATQVAETKATTQKDRAAETLTSVAQSIRDAGGSMRDQQPQIAGFADQAASRVEEISSYVRDHDVRDLVSETERLARREPLLFLGGAFAIGFVAARFLKASSPQGTSNGNGAYGYNAYAAGGNGASYPELTTGGSMYSGGAGSWADNTASVDGQSENGSESSWNQGTEQSGFQSSYENDYQGSDRIGRE